MREFKGKTISARLVNHNDMAEIEITDCDGIPSSFFIPYTKSKDLIGLADFLRGLADKWGKQWKQQ